MQIDYTEYKYVRAWGDFTQANTINIERQMKKAAEEEAPLDAIRRRDGDSWMLVSELDNDEVVTILNNRVKQYV